MTDPKKKKKQASEEAKRRRQQSASLNPKVAAREKMIQRQDLEAEQRYKAYKASKKKPK
jgi:hypothetical protein